MFNLSIDDFEAYSSDAQDYRPEVDQGLTGPAPEPPVPAPVSSEPTGRDSRHTVPFRTETLQS